MYNKYIKDNEDFKLIIFNKKNYKGEKGRASSAVLMPQFLRKNVKMSTNYY